MKKYLIVIEETSTGYSAYCPDILGCVAAGKTNSDVEARMQKAISLHLDGMKSEGLKIPEPKAYSKYFEASIA